jgi:hypothetical protein
MKRKQNSTSITSETTKKVDNIDGDKENFRTSMFIMAFLAIPLTIVVIAAIIIRIKNAGMQIIFFYLKYIFFLIFNLKKKGNLRNFGSLFKDTKPNDLGKWIKSTKNGKQLRNGFTRLNQESDNENEPLDNSDSDSDEITVPLSKA